MNAAAPRSGHNRFYRGRLDGKTVTVANGAKVNSAYAKFVLESAWANVRVEHVNDRIHCVVGLGLSNYTFIEGETGLILFDTGGNAGTGEKLLELATQISTKPIIAVIYSHSHYTAGTQPIADSLLPEKLPVYGHPCLEANLAEAFSLLAPAVFRRANIQLGAYLPREGLDAEFGIAEPHFDTPALNRRAHVPVNYAVKDGEVIMIDGMRFVFHHAISDTNDTLIVHLPELDTVLHNAAILPFLFPAYTLRGDRYRSPPALIESIDLIRKIRPSCLIGCHGFPINDRDEAFELATLHRDALSYLYQQTVRGINLGWTSDQLVNRICLSTFFDEHPALFPAYVDAEYIIRGIYAGLIGWWSGDGADLHPPEPDELGKAITIGFGGSAKLLVRAEQAISAKEYNLAAKLLSFLLAADEANPKARALKASVLRQMAQTTRTGIQTRNFLLTEALSLEGQVDVSEAAPRGFPQSIPYKVVLSSAPDTFVRHLAFQIDPASIIESKFVFRLSFAGSDQCWCFALRYGAVELLTEQPNHFDVSFTLSFEDWARIVAKEDDWTILEKSGQLDVSGDPRLCAAMISALSQTNLDREK